ncbi:MAG: DNA repair exonuclease [Atopostipes suicloacalis]|nr:DNA repair exonuclease [Atopostipes suicloacalis]
MIRFIHAADLHLDTPFHGLQEISEDLAKVMREAPFQSLRKIIDQAIKEEVDFVLFSGDLYNTQKINIKAQSIFINELNRLKQEKIPVFLIRGNHDFITEETKKLTLQLPDNVYLYSEEVETHVITSKRNKKIAVSAFSYESQWVYERKIKEYPERFQAVDMHIGMLHGAIEHSENSSSNYAPFSLSELKEKDYDYWGLGHIHQRQKVANHPMVLYPGNIQGLHKNEKGEKGCLLVEWSSQTFNIKFIPTAAVIWEEIKVHLKDLSDINQFIHRIKQQLIEKDFTENYLIHLIVKVHPEDDEKLIELLRKKSFIMDLTNQLNFKNLWITDIELIVKKESKSRNLENLYPKEWSNAVNQTKEREKFSDITEAILKNIPNKYLTEQNLSNYRERMIEKAISKIYLR